MSLFDTCLHNLLGKRIGAGSRLEPPKKFDQGPTCVPYPEHVRESSLSARKVLVKEVP